MAPSAITIAKIPRKRRSFEGSDPIQKIQCLSEVEYSDDDSSSPKSLSPQMDGDRRAHHNELERRRRDHIKDHFMSLKDAIPLLDGEKSSRALILKRAVEYIAMMRKQIADNQNDIAQLRQQNKNLELQIKAMNGPYRKTSVLPTAAPQLFIDDDSTVGPSVSTLPFCNTNIPNNNTSSSTLSSECLLDAAANPLTNSTILSSIQSSAKPQQSTQAINLNLSTIHQSSENSAFTVPQYLNHKTSDCKADKNDIHSDININNDSSSSSTQNNAELLTSPALNPLTQSAAQASNATTTSPTAATSSEFIRQNILRSLPNPLVNLSSLLYANNCSLKFNQSFPEFDYTPDIHSRIVANSLALQNDRQLALTTVRF